jgi:hypothetical protein
MYMNFQLVFNKSVFNKREIFTVKRHHDFEQQHTAFCAVNAGVLHW